MTQRNFLVAVKSAELMSPAEETVAMLKAFFPVKVARVLDHSSSAAMVIPG